MLPPHKQTYRTAHCVGVEKELREWEEGRGAVAVAQTEALRRWTGVRGGNPRENCCMPHVYTHMCCIVHVFIL